METNKNKFSLISKPDWGLDEPKNIAKISWVSLFSWNDSKEDEIWPSIESLEDRMNSESKQSDEVLSVSTIWDFNTSLLPNTDVSSEYDNQETILLPPDTADDGLRAEVDEESKVGSPQANSNIVKWDITSISDLAKIDKNDFLGTGMTMEEYTKTQGFSSWDKLQNEPVFNNIVSTANLKCKLDLKVIALNARNTEYNSKRFSAAIMRNRNPMATALIFESGKMLWMGARSEENSKRAAKKFAKTIKNLGFDVSFSEFQIRNIVASADVGFGIKLESLNHNNSDFWQYEPEIFPGWIYRVLQPKLSVLVFSSGKLVLGEPILLFLFYLVILNR